MKISVYIRLDPLPPTRLALAGVQGVELISANRKPRAFSSLSSFHISNKPTATAYDLYLPSGRRHFSLVTPHNSLYLSKIKKTNHMEPITTSAMVGGIVGYLGEKLAKDKSIHSFFSEFSQATVDWIKPLFLKEDGSEKESVQKLQEKPDSAARQAAVKSILEIELEENPEEAKSQIEALFKQMGEKEDGKKVVHTIMNSKNVNTGNIDTGGGDFRIGDN